MSSKTRSSRDWKQLTILVPAATYQRLDELRDNRHQSMVEVAQEAIDWYLRVRSADVYHVVSTLTTRLHEVLKLTGAGYSTKQIANALGIRGKTVEWHRARLKKLLNAYSIADLILVAVRSGLVPLDS
jgi:DNA-binding NarL/FixJ family response regulator